MKSCWRKRDSCRDTATSDRGDGLAAASKVHGRSPQVFYAPWRHFAAHLLRNQPTRPRGSARELPSCRCRGGWSGGAATAVLASFCRSSWPNPNLFAASLYSTSSAADEQVGRKKDSRTQTGNCSSACSCCFLSLQFVRQVEPRSRTHTLWQAFCFFPFCKPKRRLFLSSISGKK